MKFGTSILLCDLPRADKSMLANKLADKLPAGVMSIDK